VKDQIEGKAEKKLPPVLMIDRIKEAINAYGLALRNATNQKDKASAHKNLTIAHELMC
jgi:hypothetical protein